MYIGSMSEFERLAMSEIRHRQAFDRCMLTPFTTKYTSSSSSSSSTRGSSTGSNIDSSSNELLRLIRSVHGYADDSGGAPVHLLNNILFTADSSSSSSSSSSGSSNSIKEGVYMSRYQHIIDTYYQRLIYCFGGQNSARKKSLGMCMFMHTYKYILLYTLDICNILHLLYMYSHLLFAYHTPNSLSLSRSPACG